jgi:hypothetical protein
MMSLRGYRTLLKRSRVWLSQALNPNKDAAIINFIKKNQSRRAP